MPRALASFALLALLLASPPARAASAQGSLTASVGPGLDSNPARTVGTGDALDGFVGLSATGRGKLQVGEAQQLQGRYDLGLRKYLRDGGEDLAVQQLALDWSVRLGPAAVGAEATGKWRLSRSGARDYLDGGGELFLDWSFARAFSARLTAGGRGFRYFPHRGYDFAAPQANLSARLIPARRHVFGAGAFAAMPFFRGPARVDAEGTLSPDARRDRQIGAQVSYAYRGPLALQAGYAFLRIDSNSYGEASERHRLWGAAAAKLPLRLYASAQLAWQHIRYPDGLFLSEELLLLDDESQSSCALKLAFAATERLDLEARWAAYWIKLPPAKDGTAEATTWWRHTAFVGVTLRL